MLSICPDCPTARTVRELVFCDGFWAHATYAVLPFILFIVVIRTVVRIVRRYDRDAD